jgi:serine/threonine-protein kinase
VLLAYDTLMRCQVAIKVPHDARMERGLVDELLTMDMLRQLADPHLVQLREPTQIDGKTSIVMEYVDGGSLRGVLGELGYQRPVEKGRALRMLLQVCDALHVVHRSLNLVHRDIKPENILIRGRDGLVKVGDFGIAKMLASAQRASTTAGTYEYMAPEVLSHTDYDTQVDIYSLGVVLYEALTGRLPYSPFDAQGQRKPPRCYMDEICSGRATPPHEVPRADVDEVLSRVVMRAIAAHPADRYRTAGELRNALVSAAGEDDAGRAAPRLKVARRPSAREQELHEGVARHPHHPRYYQDLGRHFAAMFRYEESRDAFLAGTTALPGNASLWLQLACAESRLGRVPAAVEAMERALRVGLGEKDQVIARAMLDIWRKRACQERNRV